MKSIRKTARGTKRPHLRLWSVEVCCEGGQPMMTVVLMAPTLQLALHAAEKRYPMFFVDGSRGHAIEADHVAFDHREGRFDAVQFGSWWSSGYLPGFTAKKPRRGAEPEWPKS